MKTERESNHKRTCRTVALVFLGLITFGFLSLGTAAIAISESKKDEVAIARRQVRNQEDAMDRMVSEITKEVIKSQYK